MARRWIVKKWLWVCGCVCSKISLCSLLFVIYISSRAMLPSSQRAPALLSKSMTALPKPPTPFSTRNSSTMVSVRLAMQRLSALHALHLLTDLRYYMASCHSQYSSPTEIDTTLPTSPMMTFSWMTRQRCTRTRNEPALRGVRDRVRCFFCLP